MFISSLHVKPIAKMNTASLQHFQQAVDSLFCRWDALRLAVEYMGGRNGQQTANEIKTYVYNYCTQNDNVTPSELSEILNEILDEEFDTICEDNSVRDISEHLIGHLKLCIDGRIDEVKQRLEQLPECVNWLDPNFKLVRPPRVNDDSDSSSDDGEGDDDEMETDTDDGSQRPRNEPQVDEDGFTMVSSKRRR